VSFRPTPPALPAAAAAAVAALGAAVDALIDVDLTQLAGTDLLGVLRAVEGQRNRLATTLDHALLAETERRGVCHEHGLGSTAKLLTALLRLHPGAAQACPAAACGRQRTERQRTSLSGIFADRQRTYRRSARSRSARRRVIGARRPATT
jgi:hypothetical protein